MNFANLHLIPVTVLRFDVVRKGRQANCGNASLSLARPLPYCVRYPPWLLASSSEGAAGFCCSLTEEGHARKKTGVILYVLVQVSQTKDPTQFCYLWTEILLSLLIAILLCLIK